MKKLILILAAAIATINCSAQNSNDIIATIEKTAVRHSSVKSSFAEKRAPKNAKTENLNGTLTFKAPDHLLMDYTNGDKFSIDATTIIIKRGGKEQKVDSGKNLMMKGLSNALLDAFQGKISKLAKEQNASVTASKEGSEYKVVLTATKKAARGYSKMAINYRVSDCSIQSMRLEEFTGLVTDYKLTR